MSQLLGNEVFNSQGYCTCLAPVEEEKKAQGEKEFLSDKNFFVQT